MSRANITFPYNKEGVKLFSELDALMLKYYRVPNETEEGALSLEAFEVGQRLQFYFATYNSVVVNETFEGKKLKFPKEEAGMAFAGLEAPFYLLQSNRFYQENFTLITGAVLNELSRMRTARAMSKENAPMAAALQLTGGEYLAVIAGLVGGTKAQREMDIELKEFNIRGMDKAIAFLKKEFGGGSDV